MQVARYWRMKKHNYRLEGIRYTNGEVRIQARPVMVGQDNDPLITKRQPEIVSA